MNQADDAFDAIPERIATMRGVRRVAGSRPGRFVDAGVALALRGRITGLAAEVAFWAVLSLVPMALVLASLLSGLEPIIGSDGVTRAQNQAISAVDRVFPDGGQSVSATVTDLFSQPRAGLLSVALVLTAWSSGRVFAAVANAFGAIMGGRDRRPWVVRRVLGVALGLGALAVVAGLLAFVVADPFDLGRVGATAVSGVVVMGLVTVLYRYAPGHRVRWSHTVWGTLVATVLWVAFTAGFRIYLELQAGNPVVVGLGGILVTLLWFYLMALGLLVGRVVIVVAYHGGHGPIDTPEAADNDSH